MVDFKSNFCSSLSKSFFLPPLCNVEIVFIDIFTVHAKILHLNLWPCHYYAIWYYIYKKIAEQYELQCEREEEQMFYFYQRMISDPNQSLWNTIFVVFLKITESRVIISVCQEFSSEHKRLITLSGDTSPPPFLPDSETLSWRKSANTIFEIVILLILYMLSKSPRILIFSLYFQIISAWKFFSIESGSANFLHYLQMCMGHCGEIPTVCFEKTTIFGRTEGRTNMETET